MRRNSGLMIYLRLTATTFAVYIIYAGFTVLLQGIRRCFNPDFHIDQSLLTLRYMLLYPILYSLFSLPNNLYTTKAIRIDDKNRDIERIKNAIKKMKWRTKTDTQDKIEFTSPITVTLFQESITASFVETELHIKGPRKYIERLIGYADFPYAAFEICSAEKE